MSLCERKVDKATKNVVKVEVHQFIVGWDLELTDEFHQVILQLTLEKDTIHYIPIGKASIVLSCAPLCRKCQQFRMAEIEQNFVRILLAFDRDFTLQFNFLVDKIKDYMF